MRTILTSLVRSTAVSIALQGWPAVVAVIAVCGTVAYISSLRHGEPCAEGEGEAAAEALASFT